MSTLYPAAISDPRHNRMIFSYIENGQCILEVQDCYNLGDMTFAVNGDTTTVLCTNLYTGQNEVVAVIDGGADQTVTFDIERLLPREGLSRLMELIRKNCGLRIYLARADICVDPFDVNDYSALEVLGEVRLGDYSRSAMIYRNYADAAAILESTTVTAYQWLQWSGEHNVATRGGLHTDPIVDVTLCDKKSCGGRCADDSDGCQVWFTVDESGVVGYTDDQFATENVLAAIPSLNFTAPAKTIQCGPRGRLLVTDSAGNIFITTTEDIFDDGVATWDELLLDIDGNDIPVLNDSYFTPAETEIYYVGDGGTLYEYFVSTGTLVPITVIPGVVNNFLAIDKKGDDILIGGLAATLVKSGDAGRSFSLVTVIDPDTGIALDAGIDITAVEILSSSNFVVGTSDDRTLYTLDAGETWYNQLIFGAGTGAITDIEYHTTSQGTDIGWMTRIDGDGIGRIYATAYGSCSEWVEVPEAASETIPDNQGLVRIVYCPDNPNVAVAVGTSDGGAGVAFVVTAEYL